MGRERVPMDDRRAVGVDTINWDDKFWRNVAPEALSGCWLWSAAIRKTDGYGHFPEYVRRGETRSHMAHRYALEQKLGRLLRRGECALHRCDVRACVNPSHLFVGTVRDNHRDAMAKGRHCAGERHGMAKITRADALSIRTSSARPTDLAKAYRLTVTTVCDIRKGKIWR